MNPSEPYYIEKGTEKDIDELAKLYDTVNEYLNSGTNYPGWKKGVYPVRETAEEAVRDRTLFVLRMQGKIAGTVILNHVPETAYTGVDWGIEADDDEILVVRTLAVHPSFMKCGTARGLLEFAKQYASETGMIALRLDVTSGNLPAISLYHKSGFRYVQTVDLGLNIPWLIWFDLYEYNLCDQSCQNSKGTEIRRYHKLVRDRIPEVIERQGETPVTRILNQEEYLCQLKRKLREETEEFLSDENPEELCDIMEVVYALAAAKGYSQPELEKLRLEKAQKNGAFRDHILLEKVIPHGSEAAE